jgi:hypothetical protein
MLLPYLHCPNELPADDLQAIEQHLVVCTQCRAISESERAFDRAVSKAMNDIAAPIELRYAISVRLAQENARVWRRRLAQVAAFAVIMLMIATIGFGFWRSRIEFTPEQFAQSEDEQSWQHSLESAEEFFRVRNLQTDIPRDFDYRLLQSLDVVELKGKPVARLDFARDGKHAKVYVLSKRDFKLKKDAGLVAAGSSVTVEVVDARSPDFVFVIVYSGGGSHEDFVLQAVVG